MVLPNLFDVSCFWSRLLLSWLPSLLSFVLLSQHSQSLHTDWLPVILLAEILRTLKNWDGPCFHGPWVWFGGLSSGGEVSKVTILSVYHQSILYKCKLPTVMGVCTRRTPYLAPAIFLDWQVTLSYCHPNRSCAQDINFLNLRSHMIAKYRHVIQE